MKKLLRFFLKLLFSLTLTLLLIEGGLRLFPGLVSRDLLVYFSEYPRIEIAHEQGLNTKQWDTVVVKRDDGGPELRIFKPYIPLTYVIEEDETTRQMMTDEIGFCNPEGVYELPQIDIITLGDSFTTCHAVDPQEIWTTQLSVLTGFSAYNLGRSSTGAQEYLQLFKKFGLQKSPKIVIMNVYGGNDFRDAAIYYFYLLGNNGKKEPAGPAASGNASPTSGALTWEERLWRYSYALNLGHALLEYSLSPTLRTEASGDEPVEEDEASEENQEEEVVNFRYDIFFPGGVTVPFNPTNTDQDEVEFAQRLLDDEIEPGIFWAITETLKEFVQLSEEHGFIPVVTYLPSAHVTYADQVVFEDPHLATLMPWYSREQRQYLERKSQEVGFVFIDLTPAFQAAAQTSDPQNLLYYRYDLHLTPNGHKVVARALDKALQDLEIIRNVSN